MIESVNIIFRNSDFLVCVKPAGVVSQHSDIEKNMPDILKEQLDVNYIGTVHRLDKNVGGVMIYSLNEKATPLLCECFSDKDCCVKKYLAVVSGCFDNKSGRFEDLLFHDSTKNKTFVVKKERKGVKYASLDYFVLDEADNKSFVLIKLNTGRTHQIRAQFSSRGHSVVGDARYGGGKGETLLWSYEITLKYKNEEKSFSFFPEHEEMKCFKTDKL